MRRLMMTLTAALLVLGGMALQADAQNGAASMHALRNASPIVKLAACNGYTGRCGCAPGWIVRVATVVAGAFPADKHSVKRERLEAARPARGRLA
jgi:hypothetical protein